MNATNQSAGLQRIQKASRFLKRVVWAYACFVTGLLFLVCLQTITAFPLIEMVWFQHERAASFSSIPISSKLVSAAAIVLTALGLIIFYRLLSLYERGVIFSPANAAQFHRLGLVAISGGVLQICDDILRLGGLNLFAPITSPWIYGGIFLMVVAWIMEEGSKIQEEQELTV